MATPLRLNLLVFGATVASYFAMIPTNGSTLPSVARSLDRKRNVVRNKLYEVGTQLNGEIEQAKSQIDQSER